MYVNILRNYPGISLTRIVPVLQMLRNGHCVMIFGCRNGRHFSRGRGHSEFRHFFDLRRRHFLPRRRWHRRCRRLIVNCDLIRGVIICRRHFFTSFRNFSRRHRGQS